LSRGHIGGQLNDRGPDRRSEPQRPAVQPGSKADRHQVEWSQSNFGSRLIVREPYDQDRQQARQRAEDGANGPFAASHFYGLLCRLSQAGVHRARIT
jgi:hypothetical protein